MVDIKTIRDWFAIALVLLFLPEESGLAMLNTRPQDWYAELHIASGSQVTIIAKNSNSSKIALGFDGKARMVALQQGQSEGVAMPKLEYALPESVAIIQTEQSIASARRVVFLNDDHYFQPGKLSIFTPSDLYYVYLLVALLIGAFMLLGFIVARCDSEERDQLEDILLE